MTAESTGQVLSATTTSTAVALLPATGSSDVLRVLSYITIALGAVVFVSLTATRAYRRFAK